MKSTTPHSTTWSIYITSPTRGNRASPKTSAPVLQWSLKPSRSASTGSYIASDLNPQQIFIARTRLHSSPIFSIDVLQRRAEDIAEQNSRVDMVTAAEFKTSYPSERKRQLSGKAILRPLEKTRPYGAVSPSPNDPEY